MTDIAERLRGDPKDPPIRHWHVGMLEDLRAGKDCGVETIAAIENLERLLFDCEMLNREAAAKIDMAVEALKQADSVMAAVVSTQCSLQPNALIHAIANCDNWRKIWDGIVTIKGES